MRSGAICRTADSRRRGLLFRYLSFIYNGVDISHTIHRTERLISAIARFYFTFAISRSLQNLLIMCIKNGSNIRHAAVAYFDVVFVADLLKLVVPIKMFLNKSQKFFTDIRFDM